MQPRAGIPRGAHAPPSIFAADDGQQQKPGREISEQELDHDLVDRRDRREVREHQEGCRRAKERKADRDAPTSRDPTSIGAAAAGSSGAT